MTTLEFLAQQTTTTTQQSVVSFFKVNPWAAWSLGGVIYLVLAVILGPLPGRIARRRGHLSASAINMMGWFGGFFIVIFPVWTSAMIWANSGPDHTADAARARAHRRAEKRHAMEGVSDDKIDDVAAALERLDH